MQVVNHISHFYDRTLSSDDDHFHSEASISSVSSEQFTLESLRGVSSSVTLTMFLCFYSTVKNWCVPSVGRGKCILITYICVFKNIVYNYV